MSSDFSSASYWETRFQTVDKSFDWLTPAHRVLPTFMDALCSTHIRDLRSRALLRPILHFGPGTSSLSIHLREAFAALSEATCSEHRFGTVNADFSKTACINGDLRDREAVGDKNPSVWIAVDVLTAAGVRELARIGMEYAHGALAGFVSDENVERRLRDDDGGMARVDLAVYAGVVDKSSADAVACGSDTLVLPRTSTVQPGGLTDTPSNQRVHVHPVWALALHMAALTQPHAPWVSVSYSKERFWFLEDDSVHFWDPDGDLEAAVETRRTEDRPSHAPSTSNSDSDSDDNELFTPRSAYAPHLHAAGVPHPGEFWTLQAKESVEVEDSREKPGAPKVCHWMFTMRRNGRAFDGRF